MFFFPLVLRAVQRGHTSYWAKRGCVLELMMRSRSVAHPCRMQGRWLHAELTLEVTTLAATNRFQGIDLPCSTRSRIRNPRSLYRFPMKQGISLLRSYMSGPKSRADMDTWKKRRRLARQSVAIPTYLPLPCF